MQLFYPFNSHKISCSAFIVKLKKLFQTIPFKLNPLYFYHKHSYAYCTISTLILAVKFPKCFFILRFLYLFWLVCSICG